MTSAVRLACETDNQRSASAGKASDSKMTSEEPRLQPLGTADRDAISTLLGARVVFDEPMSQHTTLRIGGPADAWCMPESVDELSALVRLCRERSVPLTAVGGGSNLLVLDGGIRGVVLSSRNLRGIDRREANVVWVQAGVSTGKLLSMATKWELSGVEFLGGVPGSVGGGLVMNAGTYLGEFKDVTREVTSVNLASGEIVVRNNADCEFVYRGSALPKSEVVVSAIVDLTPRPLAEIKAEVRSLRDRRNEREPKKVSNAGSSFKNPEGDYAGRLIEATGLKGHRVGAAECSPVHANWMVNTGGATAADMMTLLDIARTRVREQFGIELRLEWKVVGQP